MKKVLCTVASLSLLFFCITPLFSEDPKTEEGQIQLNWMKGPKTVDVGKLAELKLQKNYYFLEGNDTRILMEQFGNPPTNKEVGYVAPEKENWYLVFEFDDVGYVKDDEKENLDPDKILEAYREGTEEGNKWREEKGLPPMHIVGWYQKPKYDEKTNNLEWAMLLESKGEKFVNYNIRYLGRGGVMEMVLVASTDQLKPAVAEVKQLLGGYSFKSGHRYSEFVQGDKIAQYGLTALITGGTIAAAAKFGFLKKFWKFIVAGLVALGAAAKRFLRSLFGMEEKNVSRVHREQEDVKNEEA